MTTLAIVGSRRFANPRWAHLAGAIIDNALRHLQPGLVVSGGAEGVDTLAANLARHRGFQVEELKPTVDAWDAPGGYRERNLAIVDRSTHLLCIRCGDAQTYGSGWTADEAERQGAQVFRRTVGAADEVDVNGWCFCGLAHNDPHHQGWHDIVVWNEWVQARGQERRDKEFEAKLEVHERRRAAQAR